MKGSGATPARCDNAGRQGRRTKVKWEMSGKNGSCTVDGEVPVRTRILSVVGIAITLMIVTSCALSQGDDPVVYQDSTKYDPEIDYETIAIGSFHYHSNWCRKCHFSSGRSGKTARGPSLIDDQWLHCDGSVEGIARVIRDGVSEDQIKTERFVEMMPPASMMNLSDEQIQAIASYVWVLNQAPEQESVEP